MPWLPTSADLPASRRVAPLSVRPGRSAPCRGGRDGIEPSPWQRPEGHLAGPYALDKLGAIGNVYNYIDAARHGWIGWEGNFGPTADMLRTAATASGNTVRDVTGFIVSGNCCNQA